MEKLWTRGCVFMGKRQTMRSIYINTPLFSGVVYDILREVVLTRAAALPDLIPPYLLFRPYTWVSLPADIWNSNTGSSRSTLLFQIYYKQLHLLCRDSEGKRTETLWIFPLPFGKAAKTWEIRWTALCRGSASVVRDTAEMLLLKRHLKIDQVYFCFYLPSTKGGIILVRYWLCSIYDFILSSTFFE